MGGYKDLAAGKYEDRNPVSRFLVRGFYGGIADILQGLPVETALEVGCGEGFSTARLGELLGHESRLDASDVDSRLVAAARQRNPGLCIREESISALQREDRSYDLVIALEVLEHLEDPAAALRELARVSRQWLLLSVPREPLWRLMNIARFAYLADLGNTPGHLQHWSSQGFLKLIQGYATPTKTRRPIPWTQVLARVRD